MDVEDLARRGRSVSLKRLDDLLACLRSKVIKAIVQLDTDLIVKKVWKFRIGWLLHLIFLTREFESRR